MSEKPAGQPGPSAVTRLLRRITEHTGGQYFRARSGEGLARIFEIIDELETTELETTIFTNYRQMMMFFLIPALLLLLLEKILSATFYRITP